MGMYGTSASRAATASAIVAQYAETCMMPSQMSPLPSGWPMADLLRMVGMVYSTFTFSIKPNTPYVTSNVSI